MAGDGARETWTIAEYLDAIRGGDQTATERFWRCARRLALGKARRLFLSREDAEDAAMEAYCAARGENHAALVRVTNPATAMSGWIAGVLDHVLARMIRRRARAHADPRPDLGEREVTQRWKRAEERTNRLGPEGSARLGELTSRQRGAFKLHLEGLHVAAIAKRLGVGREAARERIWRAWALLKAPTRTSLHADLHALLGPNGPWTSCVERETLLALAVGQSYLQVASNRGESVNAVRSRVQHVRRRAR